MKPGVELTLQRPAQGTITRSFLKSAYAGENGSLPEMSVAPAAVQPCWVLLSLRVEPLFVRSDAVNECLTG